MKNSFCFSAIVLGVILFPGCKKDLDARKQLRPEFQSLEYPKDKPTQLKSSRVVAPVRPLSPLPSSGAGIQVRVIRNSTIVTGQDTVTGTLTRLSDSLLRLVPSLQPQDTITIGVTLPAGLQLGSIVNPTATLAVNDFSSLAGADQDVEIVTGPQNRLYLRYVWKVSTKGIGLGSMGGAISLAQDSLLPSIPIQNQNSISAAKLFFRNGPQTTQVAPGNISALGNFKAYVQSSLYQGVKDTGSDARRGYVLHAIVLRQ